MAETQEDWLPIENCPNYYISNMGNVKSTKRSRHIIMKLSPNTSGYLQTTIRMLDKSTKVIQVHIIVATMFIPNPEKRLEVNHKKGIKFDNRASELEWNTHQENIDHAVRTGLMKRGSQLTYSKLVLDTSTGIFYESVTEAAIAKNMKNRTLHHWLFGDRKNKSPFILV